MSELLKFLTTLCETGEVVLRQRPRFDPSERGPVLEYLSELHGDALLDLAGPVLAFDEATALAATELTWHACWFLVSHEEPSDFVEAQLQMPAIPTTAASHIPADLMFRFLPQVHRRANARAPEDVLSKQLGRLLREWPLSGVLSSVTQEPLTPLQFDEHRGLLMLYAERWARNPKPLWRGEGLTAEYCSWIARTPEPARPCRLSEEGST